MAGIMFIIMLNLITILYILLLYVIPYLIMDCNVQYTSHLSSPVKLVVTYFTKLQQKLVVNNSVMHTLATFNFFISERNYL